MSKKNVNNTTATPTLSPTITVDGAEPWAEFVDRLDGPLWELREAKKLAACTDTIDANCKGNFNDDDIPF